MDLKDKIKKYCEKNRYFAFCFNCWECPDTEDEFYDKLMEVMKKFGGVKYKTKE